MSLLVFEELDFSLSFLDLDLAALFVALFDSFDLAFEFDDLVFELRLLGIEFIYSLLKISLSVFGLELLAHGECHRALIKRLVSSNCHLNFVTDSQQQQSSLGLTQSHLPNDLVKALREELFAHRTDSGLPCLPLHQFLVKHLSEPRDIHARRRLMTHVLYVVLALAKGQYLNQNLPFSTHSLGGKIALRMSSLLGLLSMGGS